MPCTPTRCDALCRSPLQVKAASDFHKSKRRRLGLHIYCKTCCAAASASRAKTKQPVTQPTVEAKVRMPCAAEILRETLESLGALRAQLTLCNSCTFSHNNLFLRLRAHAYWSIQQLPQAEIAGVPTYLVVITLHSQTPVLRQSAQTPSAIQTEPEPYQTLIGIDFTQPSALVRRSARGASRRSRPATTSATSGAPLGCAATARPAPPPAWRASMSSAAARSPRSAAR